MSNYSYNAIGVVGLEVTAPNTDQRAYYVDLGGALVHALDSVKDGLPKNAIGPGLPTGDLAPAPVGFSIRAAPNETHGFSPQTTPTLDWTTIDPSRLPADAPIRCIVRDPAATAASPSPTLAAWAAGFGGDVNESGTL